MLKQVERIGVDIVYDTIVSADFSAGKGTTDFSCVGESGMVYGAKAVIIATGANARWLGVPGEVKYRGAGVSACATCDGFFFKNKDVAVIGGGNTAVEEAIFLTNFAKSVTLIHRRDTLRAENIMQKRLLANPKVSVEWNTIVEDINGDENKVTSLSLVNTKDGIRFVRNMDGVFVAVGHQPATSPFNGAIDLDESGYIITQNSTSCTSVRGVFAAGDVCDSVYRQAITAAAQGCMAAIDADRFLSKGET
jgi:thioredoxin reductase (NADPH)